MNWSCNVIYSVFSGQHSYTISWIKLCSQYTAQLNAHNTSNRMHLHINKIQELNIFNTAPEEILNSNYKCLKSNPSISLIITIKNSTRPNLGFHPKLYMFILPTDCVHYLSAPCSINGSISNTAWNVITYQSVSPA